MKTKTTLRTSLLLAAGGSLLAISSASAQLTWDGNSTTAPNPNGGTGTWDTTTTNWWDDTNNVTWPSSGTNNDAVFANTAGTVSIAAGGVTANDLTFNTTGYVIQSNTLTLNGTTPTITTGASITATISSLVAGSAGLTKEGAGTLILSNTSNSYSGTTIVNAGILQWAANNALASGDLTVNSGGTVTMGAFTDTVGTITLNRGVINGTTGFNAANLLRTGSGGFITTGGNVNNWPGIGLGGNFAYNTDGGNETTASIVGINFKGGSRTFTIADGVQAIDVNIGVSLFDDSAGNRNFIKAGAGTLQISGSSSQANYNLGSGTTFINDGVLLLNKGTGVTGANAVGGTGLVTVGDGTGAANSAILRYVGFNDQIVSNAITINSDGLLDLASRSDTVGAVTLAGGSITSTTGVLTGTSYDVRSGSVSARLGGAGVALTKSTAGTVTLSGANTYTGATTVSGGTLIINGAHTGTGLITVSSGATLGGTGTIAGNTTISGTLQPGNSPGTMTFAGTLALAGTTVMEIDGTSGAGVTGGHDFVNLTGVGPAGVLTYGGGMTLDIGTTFGDGTYSWGLFNSASKASTFSSITLADQYSGSLLDVDTDGVWGLTSGDNTWTFTESTGVLNLAVVPEAGTAGLLTLGLLLLRRLRRR